MPPHKQKEYGSIVWYKPLTVTNAELNRPSPPFFFPSLWGFLQAAGRTLPLVFIWDEKVGKQGGLAYTISTHLPTYPPKPLSSLWEYSFTYPLPRLSSVPHWFSYKLPKAIFKVFNNNFKNDSNACFISVLKRLVNWKDLEQVAVSLVVSQALDRRRLTHGAMKRQNWPRAAAWPAAGMKDADWPWFCYQDLVVSFLLFPFCFSLRTWGNT